MGQQAREYWHQLKYFCPKAVREKSWFILTAQWRDLPTCSIVLGKRVILSFLQPAPELVHLEPPLARLLLKEPDKENWVTRLNSTCRFKIIQKGGFTLILPPGYGSVFGMRI